MIGRPLIVCELINLSRAPRTYALRFCYVFLLASIAALAWPWGGSPHDFHASGRAVFLGFFWVELFAGAFLVPTLVAPAISTEREKHTLDLLSVAPVSDFEIVFGKLAANSALVSSILAAGLPIAFAGLLLGGTSPEQILVCSIHVLVNGLFAACISIVCSAACERSGIATSIALIVIATMIVVTFMVGGFAFLIASAGGARPGGAALWVFFTICPWACSVADASGEAVTWLHRGTAWTVHLSLSLGAIAIAGMILRSSRSPRAPKKFEPKKVPPPADGIPMASYIPGPPPVAFVPPTAAAIPMAVFAPGATPRPPAPTPPALIPRRRRLPVRGNPVYWKEVTFGSNIGRQVLVLLASIACVFILFISVVGWAITRASSSSSTDFNNVHFALVFEVGVLIILAIGAGAGTLGPEHEAGTLPILISTGMPARTILKGKLLAAARGIWPVLALVGAHLVWASITLGAPGIAVALVVIVTIPLVTALATAASLLAGKPRRAAALTMVVLFALWGIPAIAGLPAERWRWLLGSLNPFSLIAGYVNLGCGRSWGPESLPFILFGVVSIALVPLLIAATVFQMERRVRA